MLEGFAEHSDSLGNKGVIGTGDIQWMTAGSGIIHQEMPKPHEGRMYGFQLWVNLPKAHKMTNPRYRDIKASDIPVVEDELSSVKVVSGNYKGTHGAVKDLFAEILYFDIMLKPNSSFTYEVDENYNCLSYIYSGEVEFAKNESFIGVNNIVFLAKGNTIEVKSGALGAKLLLIGGLPLNEEIAWKGPIVMNSEGELDVAFEEFYSGNFIKVKE